MSIRAKCCGLGVGKGGSMLERVESFSDMISAFLEESEDLMRTISDDEGVDDDVVEGEEVETERKVFWESQLHLLQVSLAKTSSLEARIRRDLEKMVAALRPSEMAACSCPKTTLKDCRRCRMVAICERLRAAGYDCAVCKSKWRSLGDIPGEHSYLDIIHTSATKKHPVRIVIELNFQSEFDIARAGDEYKALVSRLPELFVGKPERLRGVIKVVCAAAKRCMKDNGMHMGPWRRHDYMLSKWLSASVERVAAAPVVVTEAGRQQRPKMRSSLLTFDMVGMMPSSSLHCTTAVKVV